MVLSFSAKAGNPFWQQTFSCYQFSCLARSALRLPRHPNLRQALPFIGIPRKDKEKRASAYLTNPILFATRTALDSGSRIR